MAGWVVGILKQTTSTVFDCRETWTGKKLCVRDQHQNQMFSHIFECGLVNNLEDLSVHGNMYFTGFISLMSVDNYR